jgi:adenine-specific DNA-methyltransferase
MSRDYTKYTSQELQQRIAILEKQLAENKYGLYWDKEIAPEKVVQDCLTRIPVLRSVPEVTCSCPGNHTTNILIEGDNFHSLTCLNYIFKKSIDIIYIDPPYNTGNEDFSYNDHFVDKDDGYRHSKWLSSIQKRLLLGKELLKDTGAIFISIDDNEQANLKLLCDSIFGEENFVGMVLWKSNPNGRGDDKFLGRVNEYVLCYKKENCEFNYEPQDLAQFPLKDEKGVYAEQILQSKLSYSVGMDYPLTCPDGSVIYAGNVTKEEWERRRADKTVKKAMTWRLGEDTLKAGLETGEVFFKQRGDVWKVYQKRRPVENGSAPYKNVYDEEGTRHGSNQIKDIFGGTTPFDHPKPVGLIKFLINLVKVKDPLILDFYAGSGTTGQAVMELNKIDSGNRRFILCTNNENGICEQVTLPRLKTVITGKRKDGSTYSDGIPSNLYLFKTDFINDSPNRDQAKFNLVSQISELLCISENIFDIEEKNDSYAVFKSPDGRKMFIYYDIGNQKTFVQMAEKIKKAGENSIVYIFSTDNFIDEPVKASLPNCVLKPIPEKIYEIYKSIVEDIKNE